MIKNVIKIVLKSICIVAIFIGLWVFLTPYFRIDKDVSGDQFRNLPEDSIDILILGSSHAQYSMNPAVFYEETGYYAYVLGSGCQPMTMSYYMLVEALKTQKPEVVILDVFTMMPSSEMCYDDGMFYRALNHFTDENRMEAADNIDNKDKILEYKYDLLMNHDKWKREDFNFEDTTNHDLNYMMGYVSQDPKEYTFRYVVEHERSDTDVKINQKDLKALLNIYNLCNENDIKLILMKAPIDIDQENYDYLQAIWDIADYYGIDHVDLIEKADEIDFAFGADGDSWHNSNWGAEKCSKYMAKYIERNGLVLFHTYNDVLESLCQSLSSFTVEKVFKNNVDIYQLLEYASKYDVTMLIKYKGSYKSSITSEENELLQNAGADFDFINNKKQNYYAIIQNQEVIVDGNEPIEYKLNGKNITINNDKIVIDNETFDNLGELEIIFLGNDFNWINEVPIDYSSRWFWKSGCNGWDCEEKE